MGGRVCSSTGSTAAAPRACSSCRLDLILSYVGNTPPILASGLLLIGRAWWSGNTTLTTLVSALQTVLVITGLDRSFPIGLLGLLSFVSPCQLWRGGRGVMLTLTSSCRGEGCSDIWATMILRDGVPRHRRVKST